MPLHRKSANLRFLGRQFSEGKLSRRAFLRHATLLGLPLSGALSLIGSNPAQAAGRELPSGGTLKIAMDVLDVSSPHTFEWVQQSNVSRQVCEYLTRTDQEGITHPYLAESWEASDDLRTWTFHLRDVKWRSGRRLVAQDVAWNLSRVLNPVTGSSATGLMGRYLLKEEGGGLTLWDSSAIEVVDDRTLRLNLSAPRVAVPEDLFHYPLAILDPEEDGRFGVGSNGTGPFELVEHENGARSLLRRRGGHWSGGPYLDAIEFVDVGTEPGSEARALADGMVQGIYEGNVDDLEAILANDRLQLYDTASAQTAVARMQVDREQFKDPRVRRAMRLAIDSQLCLERAHANLGAPAEHHHVCPVHPDYYRLQPMNRDVDAARALLAEAGYPDGIDLRITCKSDPPWEHAAVEVMAEQWSEAGIRVAVECLPPREYFQVWNTVPFGFTTWGHRPLGFMALALAYRSGVPWNESHYANSRFDELLARAEGTLDMDERRTLMGELETILQQDGPIVQPIWRAVFAAYDKRVRGFSLHPSLYIHGEQLAIVS